LDLGSRINIKMEFPILLDMFNRGLLTDWGVNSLHEADGKIYINGLVALPVLCTAASMQRTEDIEVYDKESIMLGVLCLTDVMDGIESNQLTEYQLIAYLSDASDLSTNEPRLSRDYLVLHGTRLSEYLSDYADGAPIWGAFCHPDKINGPYRSKRTSIQAVNGIVVPTEHHKRSLRHATCASHPYDRYLKLYHQMELLFDWVVVRQIKALQDDLQGYSSLLSNYSAQDLPRLKELCRSYITNHNRLAVMLFDLFVKYESKAKVIFFDFGKSGNPLDTDDKWNKFKNAAVMTGSPFGRMKKEGLANRQDAFHKIVSEIAAYWIFRIRCSAAHHRIGECILVDDDEEFVVEFGEKVLTETLCQVLASEQFKKL
jgi:hypothetical protein